MRRRPPALRRAPTPRSPPGRARPTPAAGNAGAARRTRARARATRRRRPGTGCRSSPGRSRGSSVRVDEGERPRPRVVGGVLELLLLAVEEAVRRAVVGDDLVLDVRVRERLFERGVVLCRDALVVT